MRAPLPEGKSVQQKQKPYACPDNRNSAFFNCWWSTTKTVTETQILRVSFTSDDRQNSELDIRIGKAGAVMRQLHRYVTLNRELCTRAKLSNFRSIYVPVLTYGHERWIMNEKARYLEFEQPKWDFYEELAV